MLIVAAAVIVQRGRLLVVSKRAAPDVFYLPGGKPDPGEDHADAVRRELAEELDVRPATLEPWTVVDDVAALEGEPMRMTVFSATLSAIPRPAAELAALAWTDGADGYAPLLAPAIRNQVVPLLRDEGRLAGLVGEDRAGHLSTGSAGRGTDE